MRKKLILIVGTLCILIFASPIHATTELEVMQAVHKNHPELERKYLFQQPHIQGRLGSYRIFTVSTLEHLPPPVWTVAIGKKGQTLLLNGQNDQVTVWNQLIENAKVKLNSKKSIYDFILMYVGLAAPLEKPRSRFNAIERNSISEKHQELYDGGWQFRKKGSGLNLKFLTKSPTGRISHWTLLVNRSGKLLRKSRLTINDR